MRNEYDDDSNTEIECVSPNLSTDSFPKVVSITITITMHWPLNSLYSTHGNCSTMCRVKTILCVCACVFDWLKCELVDTITPTATSKVAKKWRKSNQRPYISLPLSPTTTLVIDINKTSNPLCYPHRIHVLCSSNRFFPLASPLLNYYYYFGFCSGQFLFVLFLCFYFGRVDDCPSLVQAESFILKMKWLCARLRIG